MTTGRMRQGSGARRWLAATGIILAMLVVGAVVAWPVVVRHLVVSRLEGLTHRTVHVDTVLVNPFTGRVAVTGIRIFEPDGATVFADVERFDARVRPLALFRGHLAVADAALQAPTIRLVRRETDFNISDILDRPAQGDVALDV